MGHLNPNDTEILRLKKLRDYTHKRTIIYTILNVDHKLAYYVNSFILFS
jgi:hypothetical protein